MGNNIWENISSKNISFLFGSGSSAPYLKTLSLGEKLPSFEEVITHENSSQNVKDLLYVYYYITTISKMWIDQEALDESGEVADNYKKFVEFLILFLNREGNERPKRINIFTTNYDLFFERTFDEVSKRNVLSFFNDGSRGFINRNISIENYHLTISHKGVHDFYKKEVPTINLYKMHGSVNWSRNEQKIMIDYNKYLKERLDNLHGEKFPNLVDDIDSILTMLDKGEKLPADEVITKINDELADLIESKEWDTDLSDFVNEYNSLPIINPDKWKFNQTVFEQHYYQLLRELSFELEKDNAVLIVFGFSFQDEHIREIIRRSLSNPTLLVIVITYSKKTQEKISNLFSDFNNLKYFPEDDSKGDFNYLINWLLDNKEGEQD